VEKEKLKLRKRHLSGKIVTDVKYYNIRIWSGRIVTPCNICVIGDSSMRAPTADKALVAILIIINLLMKEAFHLSKARLYNKTLIILLQRL